VLRPAIDVRLASLEDRDDLVDLWVRAREEHTPANRAMHGIPTPALRERLGVLLSGDQVQILVGRRDGRCAGFAVLRESTVSSVLDTRLLLIEHLFVHPQHRRVGLAKAMLGAASLIAERARLEHIVCNLPPSPRETHRFFARLGFAPVLVRRVAATSMLRRRLMGDQRRRRLTALEDLAFRRRSVRERPDLGERREPLTRREASGG
jgi:ribosomal protein S18 acetylase RimI-like enzyme